MAVFISPPHYSVTDEKLLCDHYTNTVSRTNSKVYADAYFSDETPDLMDAVQRGYEQTGEPHFTEHITVETAGGGRYSLKAMALKDHNKASIVLVRHRLYLCQRAGEVSVRDSTVRCRLVPPEASAWEIDWLEHLVPMGTNQSLRSLMHTSLGIYFAPNITLRRALGSVSTAPIVDLEMTHESKPSIDDSTALSTVFSTVDILSGNALYPQQHKTVARISESSTHLHETIAFFNEQWMQRDAQVQRTRVLCQFPAEDNVLYYEGSVLVSVGSEFEDLGISTEERILQEIAKRHRAILCRAVDYGDYIMTLRDHSERLKARDRIYGMVQNIKTALIDAIFTCRVEEVQIRACIMDTNDALDIGAS